MEIECFTNSSDDFDADRPWQAVGDIVDDLIRRLLAEAGGSRSAARGAGEESGPPRTLPVVVGRRPTGEEGMGEGGDHDRASVAKKPKKAMAMAAPGSANAQTATAAQIAQIGSALAITAPLPHRGSARGGAGTAGT